MDQGMHPMSVEPEEYEINSGERVVVGLFRPEDGPGIARLFQAVYGDGYPVKRFYDPQGMVQAHESGENFSVTARKPGGEVVGHVAIFRSSPYPNLYEAGAGLVLSQYRKAGINKMLLSHLYDRVVPAIGVDSVWGEAVCNHTIMQRTVQGHGHVETGLEVDLMPAEAYEREKSASGRVASVLCFRAYRHRPHKIHLPSCYQAELRFLYEALDSSRSFEISRDPLPAGVVSGGTSQTFEFAGVSRINVTEMGEDFEKWLGSLEKELLESPTRVIQAWLNLACPWVGHAVSVLRGRGYFLGGVLPRWFDDDAILMQKIIGAPDWAGIHLLSDRSRRILELIRTDWASTLP